MFLKKWFNVLFNRKVSNTLRRNDLFDWLKNHSDSIDYGEKSAYFKISGITIRYSDHLATKSDGSLHIIKLEDRYIAFTSDFKLPKSFTDIERLKLFIEDFIFIYQSYHKHLVPPLAEILAERNIKLAAKKIIDEDKLAKIKLIGNDYAENFDNLVHNISLVDQAKLLSYYEENPNKATEIVMFIIKYANKQKDKKEKALNTFLSEKYDDNFLI